MNIVGRKIVVFGFFVCGPAAFAATVQTSSLDSGGQRTTSGSYMMDGSAGGVAGISSAAAATAKQGYIAQLFEVTDVLIAAAPQSVEEGGTSQLSGIATCDDATATMLAGSDIGWNVLSGPILSISVAGVATSAVVYADSPASVQGKFLGVAGSLALTVLNTAPDNFGSYASDGLPDDWQVLYFGLDNPDASPGADASGTGQNNLFKYIAGLDPTNAASVFLLRVEDVSGQPDQKNLVFSPRLPGRTYTPQFTTDLTANTWEPLTGVTVSDNGDERTVTDLNATERQKFYRVQITLP